MTSIFEKVIKKSFRDAFDKLIHNKRHKDCVDRFLQKSHKQTKKNLNQILKVQIQKHQRPFTERLILKYNNLSLVGMMFKKIVSVETNDLVCLTICWINLMKEDLNKYSCSLLTNHTPMILILKQK